jgi:protein tyrosine phosphatase (PTP) superfamily phosphohydrolase (DUF442 family)
VENVNHPGKTRSAEGAKIQGVALRFVPVTRGPVATTGVEAFSCTDTFRTPFDEARAAFLRWSLAR